ARLHGHPPGQESEPHPAEVRAAPDRESESEKRPEEPTRPKTAPWPARLASEETTPPLKRRPRPRSPTTTVAARRVRPSTDQAKIPTPPRTTAAVVGFGRASFVLSLRCGNGTLMLNWQVPWRRARAECGQSPGQKRCESRPYLGSRRGRTVHPPLPWSPDRRPASRVWCSDRWQPRSSSRQDAPATRREFAGAATPERGWRRTRAA